MKWWVFSILLIMGVLGTFTIASGQVNKTVPSIPACFDTDYRNLTTMGTCTTGNLTFNDHCLPSNVSFFDLAVDLPAGNYSLVITPDYTHKVYEQQEKRPTQSFFIVKGPNIQITAIDINVSNDDTGAVNGSVILRATVANIGNATSPPLNVTFNISDESNTTTYDAIRVSIPSLPTLNKSTDNTTNATNNVNNATVNTTFYLPAGKYDAEVIVDKEMVVAEESEIDNQMKKKLTIDGPDLTFFSMTGKSVGNATNVTNATVFVNITITSNSSNTGWTTRNSTATIQIFDLSNVSNISSIDVFTPSFKNNQVVVLQTNFSLPAGGYNMFVTLDSENVIHEVRENENKNLFPLVITVYGPDFTIVGTSYNTTIGNSTTNATIFINTTVRNNMSSPAGDSWVTFQLKDGLNKTATQEKNISIGPIAMGENITINTTMFAPPGQYDLIIIADGTNAVTEEKETNNVDKRRIGIPGPDFSIHSFSIINSTYSTGTQNASIIVRAIIRNNISSPTESAIITFRAHDKRNLTSPEDNNVSIGPLGVGENITINTTLNVPAGDYNIILIVDGANTVTEANEMNNDASIPIFINGPDCQVVFGSVTIVKNATLNTNATINVSVNILGITNLSRSWTGTNTITAFKPLDVGNTTPDNVATFDSEFVNTPQVNNGSNVSVSAIITLPPGKYKIVAIADATNTIQESYEANNNVTSSIFIVPGPSLKIVNATTTIEGVANSTANASTSISIILENNGSSSIAPTEMLVNITNEHGKPIYLNALQVGRMEERGEKIAEYYCGFAQCKREVFNCIDEGYSFCSRGRCVSRIDLIPESIDFYPISSNSSTVVGNLSIVIRNAGDSIAAKTTTKLNVSGMIQFIDTKSLLGGEEVIVQGTYTLPIGSYTSVAFVDSTQLVNETNESNNKVFFSFNASPFVRYRRNITVINKLQNQSLSAGYVMNFTLNHSDLVATGKSLPDGNDIRIYYAGSEIDRVNITPFQGYATRIEFRTQQQISSKSNDSQYELRYTPNNIGLPPSSWTAIYNMSADGSFTTNAGWTVQGSHLSIANGSAMFSSLARNVNEWIYTPLTPPKDFKVSWKHFVSSAGSASAVCFGSTGAAVASCSSSYRSPNKDNATEFHQAVSGGGTQYTRNLLWEAGSSQQNEIQDTFVGTEYRCTQIFYKNNLTFWCDGKSFNQVLLKSKGLTLSYLFAIQSFNDGFSGQQSGWVDDLRISPYVSPEPDVFISTEEKI